MSELLPVFLVSCLLSWFSHIFSTKDDIRNTYIKKEKIFFAIMAVIMTVFVGLRVSYNDTSAYIHAYNMASVPDSFRGIFEGLKNSSISDHILYVLIQRIFKYYSIPAQQYLMFYAVITLIPYLWFINKYSNNVFFSVFLMYALGVYTFCCAGLKQSVAVAFCLIAIDCFINKKYILFALFVFIGILFHPYAFLFYLVPVLKFVPGSKNTYLMLILFFILGIALQPLMGTVINITTLLGEEYTEMDLSGAGVNPFRVAVCNVPLFLFFLVRKNIPDDHYTSEKRIILNLTFLNGEIIFVGLFGTANYFARLANFFLIFQVLSIPWLLKYLDKKYRALVSITAFVLYSLFFVYQNYIVINFDRFFNRISFMDYLNNYIF